MAVTKEKREKSSPPGRAPIPAPDIEPLSFDGKEPIERQVYVSLRRALMSGAMLPGSRISSRSIAASLGISTMPVREALKRLESDGALKSAMKSAFIIPFPTPAEFEEILQIRLRLEIMLAREAVAHISDEQIDEVEWLQDRMSQSRSWRQVLNYNQQMHFTIYNAADMPYALSLVENVWVRAGSILHVIYGEQYETTPFDPHNEIIEGLRARDPAKVESGIRRDLAEAAHAIMKRLPSAETG